jgi:hypothetical protein
MSPDFAETTGLYPIRKIFRPNRREKCATRSNTAWKSSSAGRIWADAVKVTRNAVLGTGVVETQIPFGNDKPNKHGSFFGSQ